MPRIQSMWSRQANEILSWVIWQLGPTRRVGSCLGFPASLGNSWLVPQSTFERHARLLLTGHLATRQQQRVAWSSLL